MNLIEQLEADLKQSLQARDELKTNVLRMLKAALQNQQIEVGHELSSAEILRVLQKEAKKRQDSASAYGQAGRTDLADTEKSEVHIIESYLPEQLSDEQLDQAVSAAISKTGAQTMADMGKVMALVMSELSGQVDGARVSALAAKKLNSKV